MSKVERGSPHMLLWWVIICLGRTSSRVNGVAFAFQLTGLQNLIVFITITQAAK